MLEFFHYLMMILFLCIFFNSKAPLVAFLIYVCLLRNKIIIVNKVDDVV